MAMMDLPWLFKLVRFHVNVQRVAAGRTVLLKFPEV
jgi:hypothetical protein